MTLPAVFAIGLVVGVAVMVAVHTLLDRTTANQRRAVEDRAWADGFDAGRDYGRSYEFARRLLEAVKEP